MSFLDSVIVILYITLSFGIGFFMRKYIKTMSDFVTAGQKCGVFLGVASMAGTEMGLITIMYSAQKGFTGGFAAFHIAVIAGVVTFLVGITGFIVAPLRREKVLTIPEYYEKRFNKKARVLGGILLTLGGLLNMGLFLKVGAMFLIGITGVSQEIVPWVMTGLLVVILVYTMSGGMMSVIITDFLQFVIMAMGLLVVIVISLNTLSWDTLVETVWQLKGASGFDPFSSEGTFGLSYVLWMILTAGLVSCAIWPTAVARALAMESEAAVKKQYMIASVTFMIRFLIPYFLGICAFVYFKDTGVDHSLMALPLYLKAILPMGVLGLITAGMIAAFMSTHDGYLLCWSSVITQDIIAPLVKRTLTDQERIKITRIMIVLIGVYIWYWGLIYQGTEEIWDYMAITGAIYFTGASAVLIGGLYWTRASSTGALWSLLAGFTALLGLGPIKTWCGLEGLTGAQIGLGAVLIATLCMIVGSMLFPDRTLPGREEERASR